LVEQKANFPHDRERITLGVLFESMKINIVAVLLELL
jgi:hypothetical protein